MNKTEVNHSIQLQVEVFQQNLKISVISPMIVSQFIIPKESVDLFIKALKERKDEIPKIVL